MEEFLCEAEKLDLEVEVTLAPYSGLAWIVTGKVAISSAYPGVVRVWRSDSEDPGTAVPDVLNLAHVMRVRYAS